MSNDDVSEAERIERLGQLGILDTPPVQRFRRCAEEALKLFDGTAIAAVSLVDVDRQWFKAIIGSNMTETPRSISFCSHAIESQGPLVVEDATRDPRFADNPLVRSDPNIRFYVGVKLVHRVGTLCVIGLNPRRATDAELRKLIKLSSYVDIQLLAEGALHNLAKLE